MFTGSVIAGVALGLGHWALFLGGVRALFPCKSSAQIRVLSALGATGRMLVTGLAGAWLVLSGLASASGLGLGLVAATLSVRAGLFAWAREARHA